MFKLLIVVFAFSLIISLDQVLAELCCQGTTAGNCCAFPFIYEGKSYNSCTTVNYGNILWCATTNNYDKDRKWGKCKIYAGQCSQRTTSGICCVFPFVYKGKSYNSCTTVNYGNIPWCATTSNYDNNGKWGKCKGGTGQCSHKTTAGINCVFPFIYQGKIYNSCTTVNYGNIPWCATTSNYDKNRKWGKCKEQCSQKTTAGICCVFPFIYQGKCYNGCTTVNYGNIPWCATTNNYDKNRQWGRCADEVCSK